MQFHGLRGSGPVLSVYAIWQCSPINFYDFCRLLIVIRASNRFDPDQVRHSIGPDLKKNICKRVSADERVATSRLRVNYTGNLNHCINWLSI